MLGQGGTSVQTPPDILSSCGMARQEPGMVVRGKVKTIPVQTGALSSGFGWPDVCVPAQM